VEAGSCSFERYRKHAAILAVVLVAVVWRSLAGGRSGARRGAAQDLVVSSPDDRSTRMIHELLVGLDAAQTRAGMTVTRPQQQRLPWSSRRVLRARHRSLIIVVRRHLWLAAAQAEESPEPTPEVTAPT
jgi:hypothetical protein